MYNTQYRLKIYVKKYTEILKKRKIYVKISYISNIKKFKYQRLLSTKVQMKLKTVDHYKIIFVKLKLLYKKKLVNYIEFHMCLQLFYHVLNL